MKFAFWNVHQNPVINHYIVDLIYENELDIIVLAEYKDNEQKLIDELIQKGIYMEKYLTSGCDRIMMFGSIQKVMPANQNKYYSIQIIDKKYILCGMHLPSRIYSDHQERRNIVIDRIVEDIIWISCFSVRLLPYCDRCPLSIFSFSISSSGITFTTLVFPFAKHEMLSKNSLSAAIMSLTFPGNVKRNPKSDGLSVTIFPRLSITQTKCD